MDSFSAARQREEFPLPPVEFQGKATKVLQGSAPRAWESAAGFKELTSEGRAWLSDGVGALNCLAGRGYACSGAPHLAQRRAMAHVVDCFRQVPERPEGLTGASAFRDLTSGCRLYCTDRGDVQPYAKLRISWPDVGAQPIVVSDFARPEDRERLIGWRQHLLRSAGDAAVARQESGVVRPYMDSVLRRSKRQYGEFVKELSRRGLVRFRRCTSTSFTVGVFFVVKKTGQLRIVFDTRLANCDFIPAASTRLPSAASFASLEGEGALFGATADVANAFYGMSIPDELGQRFTLPAVTAGEIGIDGFMESERIQPYLCVLPMGWNWALHFCQSVVQRALGQVIGEDRILEDRKAGLHL